MSAFDRQFDEFLEFMPDRLQVISRRAYTKEEAKNIYDKQFEADVLLEDIKEGWVRWQPSPSDFRDEGLGDFCWLTCEATDKGAQPTWMINE